jgi:hypothetical protein
MQRNSAAPYLHLGPGEFARISIATCAGLTQYVAVQHTSRRNICQICNEKLSTTTGCVRRVQPAEFEPISS